MMKKYLSILLCAIAAISCNKEAQEIPEGKGNLVPMTFTATTTETRTTLDEDHVTINWLSTDKISVFDAESNNNMFETTGSGKTVEFSGSAAASDLYYALYPYNAAATIMGMSVKTTLAANQAPVDGTFADGLNINAAMSADETTFVFDNVLSVAKFTLNASNLGGKTIKSVKFTSTYPLAGDVVVTYSPDGIYAAAGEESVNEVTLTNADGFADGTYYFVVLPNAGGEISMTFESTDGFTATKTATLGKAFTAGNIKNLGTVKGLTWVNSYSIVFGKETNQSGAPLSVSTQASTVISEGLSYVKSRPFTVTDGNAYYGDGDITALRVGKSKAAATVKIALSDAGSVCASKIVVNCKQMSSVNAGALSVNGSAAQNVPASAGDLIYYFNDVDISEIELAATLSTFIYSIEVTYRSKLPVSLSFGDQTSFEITQGDSFTAPTLTTDPAGLSVTYTSSNESVATVNASTGEVTPTGIGSTTITATFAGNETYGSGSASYTLTVNRALSTSIAQIKADLNGSTTSMSFTVSLSNAIVTRKYSDYIAYIQDDTAGILVTDAEDLEQGDSFTGTVTGEMETYQHQPRITSIDVSGATKQTGATRTPEVVTISSLVSNMSSYDGKLCKIVKAKAGSDLDAGTNKSITIYQGQSSLKFFTRAAFAEGAVKANNYYDIIGIPCLYGSDNEIVVVSTNDVSPSSITWQLNGIAVKTPPTKLSYQVGDFFDPTGLVISTTMEDTTDPSITKAGEDVTYSASTASSFTFTPDLSTALATTNTVVTIAYGGKNTTQSIMVSESGSFIYTSTFTSKSWGSDGDFGWTSGKDGAGFSNNGIQVTTNDSYNGANATTNKSFTNVSKVVVTYNTNKNAGSGTLSLKIGNNTETTGEWAYSGSADGRTANFTCEFDYSTAQSGAIKLTANTTTNSIYIVSVKVTASAISQ